MDHLRLSYFHLASAPPHPIETNLMTWYNDMNTLAVSIQCIKYAWQTASDPPSKSNSISCQTSTFWDGPLSIWYCNWPQWHTFVTGLTTDMMTAGQWLAAWLTACPLPSSTSSDLGGLSPAVTGRSNSLGAGGARTWQDNTLFYFTIRLFLLLKIRKSKLFVKILFYLGQFLTFIYQ